MKLPFSAFVGGEDAKLALILNLINPKIGGLLLRGPMGSGKSTLLESLVEPIHCPCHIQLENLLGTIDFEQSLASGKAVYQSSLLAKTDGKVLLLDGLQLFNRAVISSILQTQQAGFYFLERQGHSLKVESNFSLLAAMNPEESLLPSSVEQSFGMIVDLPSPPSLEQRLAVIKTTYMRSKDYNKYLAEDEALRDRISLAKTRLATVELPFALQLKIAQAIEHFALEGNYLELRIYQACLALAAFYQHPLVTTEDFDKALSLVLSHRAGRQFQSPQSEADNQEQNKEESAETSPEDSSSSSTENQGESADDSESGSEENHAHDEDNPSARDSQSNSSQEVKREKIGSGRKIKLPIQRSYLREQVFGSGKREKKISSDGRGHAVYSRQTDKYEDIDVFASLLKAAPQQRLRKHMDKDKKIIVKKSDLQRKIREQRIGFSLIFLLDASGSLHAEKRMEMLKGTVFDLLSEAYVKRDKVALISFRHSSVNLSLPLTNSIYLAKQRLEYLESGGNSPIAAGFAYAYNYICSLKQKTKNSKFLLVFMSDGRANYTESGDSPIEAAMAEARRFAFLNCKKIFIDYEQGKIKLGLMEEYAKEAAAEYRALSELNQAEIVASIDKMRRI